LLIKVVLKKIVVYRQQIITERSGSLVVIVSASQPRDHGFEPYFGHDHVSSYDINTGGLEYKLKELVSQSSLDKYV
jgi:hypothetical protein